MTSQGLLSTGVTLIFVWSLVIVNVRGVRLAGRVQLTTTVLKILPLIAVAAFGLFSIELSYFQPFNLSNQSDFSALTATASLTMWAFLGMESANIPAAEVENATGTVPRAAVAGTCIAALVYIPGTVAVMGLISPEELVQSNAPFAEAAATLWGPWGYNLIGLGAIVSCFGALNGWTLCLGQIPMAAAKDKLFPRVFAKKSKYGTPAKGLVISSVLVSLLVLMNASESLVDQFTFVILLATLAALLPYLLCALARIFIAARSHQSLSTLEFSVCILAAIFSIWAITGTGFETIFWGSILFIAGLPIYVWIIRRSRDS